MNFIVLNPYFLDLDSLQELLPYGTKAYFAWDQSEFKEKGYSFKQILFLYECLLMRPIEIVEASKEELIEYLLTGESLETLYILNEPYKTLEEKPQHPKIQIIDVPKWLKWPIGAEKKSFFAFWKKVEPQVKEQWNQYKSNSAS